MEVRTGKAPERPEAGTGMGERFLILSGASRVPHGGRAKKRAVTK